MREAVDTLTADLLPGHDLAGERPAPLTAREKAALRALKYRQKNGLKAITVNIPAELVDQFHAKRAERGQTANEAVEKLLRTQYLRKR